MASLTVMNNNEYLTFFLVLLQFFYLFDLTTMRLHSVHQNRNVKKGQRCLEKHTHEHKNRGETLWINKTKWIARITDKKHAKGETFCLLWHEHTYKWLCAVEMQRKANRITSHRISFDNIVTNVCCICYKCDDFWSTLTRLVEILKMENEGSATKCYNQM